MHASTNIVTTYLTIRALSVDPELKALAEISLGILNRADRAQRDVDDGPTMENITRRDAAREHADQVVERLEILAHGWLTGRNVAAGAR